MKKYTSLLLAAVMLFSVIVGVDFSAFAIDSSVESFTLSPAKPYEIFENTNGFDEGDEWYYYAPDFNNGDIITVNYSNGTNDVFTYIDYEFLNENGEELNVSGEGFSFKGTGQAEFSITLRDYEKSINVPVTIKESHSHLYTTEVVVPTCTTNESTYLQKLCH